MSVGIKMLTLSAYYTDTNLSKSDCGGTGNCGPGRYWRSARPSNDVRLESGVSRRFRPACARCLRLLPSAPGSRPVHRRVPPGARNSEPTSVSLDCSAVKTIAYLARLRVADARLERLAQELSGILRWVEQLGEVNTDGVEPMTSVVAMTLSQRDDAVTDGGDRQSRSRQCAGRYRRLLRGAEGRRMTGDLTRLTLAEARDGLAGGDFSAVELTRQHLKAIKEAQGSTLSLRKRPTSLSGSPRPRTGAAPQVRRWGRSTASRSPSRTCFVLGACKQPRPPTSSRASRRPMNHRHAQSCGKAAR